MNLVYKRSQSTVQPEVVDFQKTTVYLRKDITTKEETDERNRTITLYTYLEAQLTYDEYRAFSVDLYKASIND